MPLKILFIFVIIILCINYPGFSLAQKSPAQEQEQDWIGERQFIKTLEQKLLTFWQRVKDLGLNLLASAGEIIEKRKPMIKQELIKEKEEMVQDLIKIKTFLWEKIWQRIK